MWTATSEPPTYPPTPTACDGCTFPFQFGYTTFDTCVNVQDVDTQPWCSYNIKPPTDEGRHTFKTPKITCFDSDLSCPSKPPQMLVTSPDYPLTYPKNADQVKEISRKLQF